MTLLEAETWWRGAAPPVLADARRIRIVRRPVATGGLFAVIIGLGVWAVMLTGDGLAVYGLALGTLLTGKMVLSLAPPRRRYPAAPPALRVGVVVTSYNEDPDALQACLDSLDGQVVRPSITVVVDDGSKDRRAAHIAQQWAARGGGRYFMPLAKNGGKRLALAAAWKAFRGRVDVWAGVDSDTILEPEAVAEGIRPFHSPRVLATTGTVLAANATRGLVPALIDLRYLNAFLGERAAYSRLGAVLCCCGSLSFYRAWLIDECLDDFVQQTFLGRPAVFGDDRRLTRYALDRGQVELAPRSIGVTIVPEAISHLLRQQTRWGKSFWRETWLLLKESSPKRVAWWLALVELVTWVGFGTGLVWAVVAAPLAGRPSAVAGYALWVCVSSWARSVHVFSVSGRWPWWRSLAVFATAPVYGVLSLLVLLPLRAWSLLTLTNGSWGTRESGVEVALTART